jgi:methyl-accepting chemotaxis protein
MTYSYVSSSISTIHTAEVELQGAVVNELILDLSGKVSELEMFSQMADTGHPGGGGDESIALKEIAEISEKINHDQLLEMDALKIRAQWGKLYSQLSLLGKDSTRQQLGDLSKELNQFSLKIADSAGITLDPALESYYLGDIVATRLPVAIDYTAKVADEFAQIREPSINVEKVQQSVAQWAGVILNQFEVMQRNVDIVGGSDPTLRGQFDKAISESKALYQAASQNTLQLLMEPHPDGKSVADALRQWQVALHSRDGVHDPISDVFQKIVEERYKSTKLDLYKDLGLTALLLLLASALSMMLVRAINNPISKALSAMNEMRAGNYDGLNLEQIGTTETRTLLAGLEGLRARLSKSIADEARLNEDIRGQMTAIGRVQAVVEYELNGDVILANDNFLKCFGYSQDEIKSKNHSFFTEAAAIGNADQRMLWEKLQRGEAEVGQYKRIGKGGKEIWVQASYNPIFDANGKPVKVVEYATDVTEKVQLSQQLQMAVQETQNVVKTAIEGDLTQRISTNGKTGEIESLCKGINSLLESIAVLINQVKVAANEVQSDAEEIAKGNSNLSARTEEQASSLEETASSMEEMTSTVKQTADNASQANQLAMAARQQAEKGGAVVGSAVKAMGDINNASKKIADIIGVIEEIAFQTNLLALNAAVEAARAGEQGRGFAVVATEVRNLAGRSATASKEIKTLIQDSVAKVEEGSNLVYESGKTLDEIVLAVKKVTDIVAEIAAASREQSSGIEQVNKAVMQMDDNTQQNVALVEQAAAASEAIVEQAQTLSSMIARYQVGSHIQAGSAAQVERRSAGRPWSSAQNKTAVTSASDNPVHARKVANSASRTASDNEWNEF